MNFQLNHSQRDGKNNRPRYNKRAVFSFFVCLLAVFLIYFGPLLLQISQALSSHPMMMHSMQMEAMSAHSTMSHQQHLSTTSSQSLNPSLVSLHNSHHNHHDHQASENLLEACGYCSLLFHLNWIDSKSTELIPLGQPNYPSFVQAAISHHYQTIYASIRPRAPPFLLIESV